MSCFKTEKLKATVVEKAIQDLGIDTEKANPLTT